MSDRTMRFPALFAFWQYDWSIHRFYAGLALEAAMPDLVLQSTMTCPHCGFSKAETMPTDACQWFYECDACHELLEPLPGDCCVYCSYGTMKCPPMQQGSSCCSTGEA